MRCPQVSALSTFQGLVLGRLCLALCMQVTQLASVTVPLPFVTCLLMVTRGACRLLFLLLSLFRSSLAVVSCMLSSSGTQTSLVRLAAVCPWCLWTSTRCLGAWCTATAFGKCPP